MKEDVKYNNWKTDMSLTQPCFDILKNIIFNNTKILSIENIDNEILLWFDQYAGIDYIGKNNDNNLFGVAVRIQWDIDYRTFTIRKERHTGTKTEYDKRIEAIEKGFFYPVLTLQAYFTREYEMLSAGLVNTKYLYDFIQNNPERVGANKSDNDFIFVRWTDLKKIKIY